MKLVLGHFLPHPCLVTFQGNPCEICGGKIGAGTDFAPIISALCCTNAPYSWSFIDHLYVLQTPSLFLSLSLSLYIYIYIYETINYKPYTTSQNY